MANHQFAAYEGSEGYIFVSYAHKDTDKVFPIMEQLYRRGYRLWYDDGIAPGSEWPEDIARHLNNSAMVIAFVTPNSMASANCRREINFALSKQKPFLSVVLEPTEMPLGMELQLSAQQSVIRYNYRDEETFLEKICACPGLAPCRGELPASKVPVTVVEAAPEIKESRSEKKTASMEANADEAQVKARITKKTKKTLGFWAGAAALVLIALVVVVALLGLTGGEAPKSGAPSEIVADQPAAKPADKGEDPAGEEADPGYKQATFTVHVKATHWGERMVLRGLSADGSKEVYYTLLVTEGDWITTLVPVKADSLQLSNQSNAEKTKAIPVEHKEVWVLVNKDLSYEISYTGPVKEAELKTVTVYTKVPAGCTTPHIWAWSKDGDAFDKWPGMPMTKVGNWYCAEVPSWVTGIAISDGVDNISGDFTVGAGKPLWIVTKNNWWVGFYHEPTEEDIRQEFAGRS